MISNATNWLKEKKKKDFLRVSALIVFRADQRLDFLVSCKWYSENTKCARNQHLSAPLRKKEDLHFNSQNAKVNYLIRKEHGTHKKARTLPENR